MKTGQYYKQIKKKFMFFQKEIYFYCLTILGSSSNALYVSSCVFEAAYEKVEESQSEDEIRRLLLILASEQCMEFERINHEKDDSVVLKKYTYNGETQIEDYEELYMVITEMPFVQRFFVMAFCFAELSLEEIQHIIDITDAEIRDLMTEIGKIADEDDFSEALVKVLKSAKKFTPKIVMIPGELAVILNKKLKTYRIVILALIFTIGVAIMLIGANSVFNYLKTRPENIKAPLLQNTQTPAVSAATTAPYSSATVSAVMASATPAKETPYSTYEPLEGMKLIPKKLMYTDTNSLTYKYYDNKMTLCDKNGDAVITLEYDKYGRKTYEHRYSIIIEQSGKDEYYIRGRNSQELYYNTKNLVYRKNIKINNIVYSTYLYEYIDRLCIKETLCKGENETPEHITEYQYRGDGSLRKETHYDIAGEKKILTKKLYYDLNNRMTEEIEYKNDIEMRHIFYEYDNAGNIIKQSGKIGDEIKRTVYDENSLPLLVIQYIKKDAYNYKLLSFCTEKGRTLKSINYDENFEPVFPSQFKIENSKALVLKNPDIYADYTYDRNGNLIKYVTENKSSVYGEIRYDTLKCEYDEAGRLIKEIFESGTYDSYKCKFFYDRNGNLERVQYYNLEGELRETYNINVFGKVSYVDFGNDCYAEFEYSSLGKIEKVTVNYEGSSVIFEYENGKEILRYADSGNEKWYFNDNWQRIRKEEYILENIITAVYTYEYDVNDLPVKITVSDEKGDVRSVKENIYSDNLKIILSKTAYYNSMGEITSIQTEDFSAIIEGVVPDNWIVYDGDNLISYKGKDLSNNSIELEFDWVSQTDEIYKLYQNIKLADMIP